jgi:hypothetical protein
MLASYTMLYHESILSSGHVWREISKYLDRVKKMLGI